MLAQVVALVLGLALGPTVPLGSCSTDTCITGGWAGDACQCASFDCREVCAGCPDADVQCQPAPFGAPLCSCKSDSARCYNMLPPSVSIDTVLVGAAKAVVSAVDTSAEVLRISAHPCVNLKYTVPCANAYTGCISTFDTSPSGADVLLSTNGDYTTATRKLTAMAWSSAHQPSFTREEVRVVPLPVVTSFLGCTSASDANLVTCSGAGTLEFRGFDFPLDAAVVVAPVASAPTVVLPFNQLTLQEASSTALSGWAAGTGPVPSCAVVDVRTGFDSYLACSLDIPPGSAGTWSVKIRPLSLPQGSPLRDLLGTNSLDSNGRFFDIGAPFESGSITDVYLGTCVHPDALQYCTDGALVITLATTELVTAISFTSTTSSIPTCGIVAQNATHVTCDLVLPQGGGQYGVSVVQSKQSPQWKHFINGRGGILGLQGSFLFTPPPEDGKNWPTSVMVGVSHTFSLPQGYRCLMHSTTGGGPFTVDTVAYDKFTSVFTVTEQALLTALQAAPVTYGAVAVQLYYAYQPAGPLYTAYYNLTQEVQGTLQPTAVPNSDWVIPATCTVGGWSPWSKCSAPCNTGTLYRNRTVLDAKLPPWLNPIDIGCPVLAEVENCNVHSCLCDPQANGTHCNGAGKCNMLGMCDCRAGLTGAECDILEKPWRAELLGNLMIVVIVVAILHSLLSKHPMPVMLALIECQIIVTQLQSPCVPIDVYKAAASMEWVILFPKPSAFDFEGGNLTWTALLLALPVALHVLLLVMVTVFESEKGAESPAARLRFPAATIVIASWFVCPLAFHAAQSVSRNDTTHIAGGAVTLFFLLALLAVGMAVFTLSFKHSGARYTKDEALLDGFYSEVVYSNMKATGERALLVVPSMFWSSVGSGDTTFKKRWGCMFTGLREGQVTFTRYVAARALAVGVLMGLRVTDDYCVTVYVLGAAVHLVFVFLTLVKGPWCGELQHYFQCSAAVFALFLCMLVGAIVLVDFNTKSSISNAVQYMTIAAVSIMLLLSLVGAAVWLLCRLYHARSLKDVKAYNEFHEIQKGNEVDESVPSEQAEKAPRPAEVVPVNPLLLLEGSGKKNQKVVYTAADDMRCVTTVQPNTTVCDIEKEEEARAMTAQRERRQREYNKVVYVDTSILRDEVDLPVIGSSVTVLPSAGLRHEKIIGCTGTVVRYDTSKSHHVTGVQVDVHPHKGVRRLLPEHLQVVKGDE